MELLMNEQTMKIITAGAMAYAAYRGIKKIEKVFNNRATERERIIELSKFIYLYFIIFIKIYNLLFIKFSNHRDF